MPIILTLAALPISVGGTGVREGSSRRCSCRVRRAPAVAITLSLTGFMLSVPWGMLGGLIYLLYRPSEHAGIGEAERQVRELETTWPRPNN